MDLSNLQGSSMPLRSELDLGRIEAAGKAARAAAAAANKPGATVAERRASLRSASKEFEAIFVNQMVTAMRKTVTDGGLIRKNQGQKIFESMLDEEWSKKLTTRSGSKSIGDLLYRQLSRHAGLDEPESGDTGEMVRLQTESQFSELDRHGQRDFAPVHVGLDSGEREGNTGTVDE